MTVVLLLFGLASVALVVWFTHRHRRQVAWDRELAVAFAPPDHREVARRRVL